MHGYESAVTDSTAGSSIAAVSTPSVFEAEHYSGDTIWEYANSFLNSFFYIVPGVRVTLSRVRGSARLPSTQAVRHCHNLIPRTANGLVLFALSSILASRPEQHVQTGLAAQSELVRGLSKHRGRTADRRHATTSGQTGRATRKTGAFFSNETEQDKEIRPSNCP